MNRRHSGAPAMGILVICLAGAAGCSRDIGDILGHPERFVGEQVTVEGEVVSTVAIFDHGFFEVEDGTGSIWILSRNVPMEGKKVRVTGTVKRGIRVPGHAVGVVLIE